MIMDVEKADWIIVDFIMMIVQVDLVVVMKEDTVESSHAEQTISSCIGRTDIIWIYIIW